MLLNKFLTFSLLLMALLFNSQAFAHKVNLFAYAESGEVYVEGYFVDGKAAQNSSIQVLDPAGKVLHEGVTDDKGQYRFAIPQQTDLKIIVNAGMGHQSEFTLDKNELTSSVVSAESFPIEVEKSEENTVSETLQSSSHSTLSGAELNAVVQKAVNEAIKPLVRELSASQEKASLAGIVGGVGYIIGILGLFAFFKSRQANKSD